MRKLLVITAFLLFAGIAFGQTIKGGVVLGVHDVTVVLEPDVTMNQYLDFVKTKVIPEFEKNFSGVKVFILKGTRGESEHGIGLVYWVESEELRDKYWPKDGETGEEATQALERMSDTMEKWGAMEVSYTTEYTDWVVL
jgi:hypothetical protein